MNIAVLGIRGVPSNYGGFETCAEYVSKYWSKKGHQVVIYCRSTRYKNRIKDYNGCRLKYIGALKNKSLETLTHTLLSVFDVVMFERDVNYVHLYNGGNAVFIPILQLARKKVIISIDGIEWKRKKWGAAGKAMHKLGEYISVKMADEVIADNPVVKRYYKKKYNRDVALIPYGAELINGVAYKNENEVLDRYGLTRKQYFLFVGRFVPEKGVHNLVNAYKRVKTSIPLVLVGGGEDAEYIASFVDGNDNRIKCVGYVYGDDYRILLKHALVYVTASELEGTSPSLLAAMGAKVCVLVNGIEENISTLDGNGLFSKKNDFTDFAERWEKLIRTPILIEKYADKGYRFVKKKYSWDNIAAEYLDTFRKL